MKIQKLDDNRYLVCAKEFENKITEDWFEPKTLEKLQHITGQSIGRGITYFFKKDNYSPVKFVMLAWFWFYNKRLEITRGF